MLVLGSMLMASNLSGDKVSSAVSLRPLIDYQPRLTKKRTATMMTTAIRTTSIKPVSVMLLPQGAYHDTERAGKK
jgi:hypothetical protein